MREWHWVTVASAPEQELGERLAHQLGAPDHHRPRPLELHPGRGQQLHHARGVHGTRRGLPWASSPALSGVSPSTSFSGTISEVISSASRWAGSGSWSRMPLTAASCVEGAQQPPQLLGRGRGVQLVVDRGDAHLLARLALHAHVHVRGGVVAHQDRGQARVGPRGAQVAHLGSHALAHARRHRPAVDHLGAHVRFFSGA